MFAHTVYASGTFQPFPPNYLPTLTLANHHTRYGHFRHARTLYTALPPHPITTLAHAECCIRQGAFLAASDILGTALCLADDLDTAEHRLMRLLLGFTHLSTEGTLSGALRETAAMRAWLGKVPVHEYTAIQVHCIAKYCLVINFLTLATGRNTPSGGCIPYSPTGLAWRGLEELLEHLVGVGRLDDASVLLRHGRGQIPERMSVMAGYIAACGHGESRMVLEVRLYMAEHWVAFGDIAKAGEQVDEVERLMGELDCGGDAEETSQWVDVRLVRLRMIPEWKLEARWEAAVELMRAAKRTGYWLRLPECYGSATEAAWALWEVEGSQVHRGEFLRLHKEREEVTLKETGNLWRLVVEHTDLLTGSVWGVVDLRKTLEWVLGFEQNHPRFELPRARLMMQRAKEFAYETLSDAANSEKARREALKWSGVIEEAERVGGGADSPNVGGPTGEDLFAVQLAEAVGEGGGVTLGALRMLVRWAKAEMGRGREVSPGLLALLTPDAEDTRLTEPVPDFPVAPPAAQEFLTPEALLLRLYGPRGDPVPAATWAAHTSTITAFLSSYSGPGHTWHPALQTYIQAHRPHTLVARSSTTPPVDREPRVLAAIADLATLITAFPSLPPQLYTLMRGERCRWQQSIACWHRFLSVSAADVEWAQHHAEAHCSALTSAASEMTRIPHMARALLLGRLAMGWCLRQYVKLPDTPEFNVAAAVKHLADADQIRSEIREELGLAGDEEDPIETLGYREGMGKWGEQTDVIEVLMRAQDPPAVWAWVQKIKARALSTTMGGSADLQAFLDGAEGNEECKALLARERELLARIRAVGKQERYHPRIELRDLQKEMKKHPLLRKVLAIREGTPLSYSDLKRISAAAADPAAATSRPVCFIDWFHVPNWGAGNKKDLWLIVAHPRRGLKFFPVNMDLQTVQEHATEALTRDELVNESSTLDSFQALIAPLSAATDPGDMLVLCPTQTLHRIPLHALLLDGKILLKRNPVVYTHSLSILRHCTQHPAPTAPGNAAFIAPIVAATYHPGRCSVQNLAAQFHTPAILGRYATRTAFISSAQNTQLLHYQGHATLPPNPLLHSLRLHCGDFTAQDVIGLRVSPAALVTMVACQSGKAREVPLDDVMGLVPAWMWAGAGATVSTLWAIPDSAGAEFAESFYRGWENVGWVNLAERFRSVVLKMAEEGQGESEGPYRWGAFVLHGCWGYRTPVERAQGKVAQGTEEAEVVGGNEGGV